MSRRRRRRGPAPARRTRAGAAARTPAPAAGLPAGAGPPAPAAPLRTAATAAAATTATEAPTAAAAATEAPTAAAAEAPTPADAPPAGPKTARPPKPDVGAPARPAPFPGPVRARLLAAEAAEPEGAFDALYREAAGPLRRQVYVLTGDRDLAGEAVGRAFDTAWQQWPEVARDSDPVGWLRAAAHTYALAPWQRLWRRARRRAEPPVPEGAWWRALVRLPPERRRALLLHDGLGMSLARTAAEVEASTTAAASRIIAARRALAAAAPEEYDGGGAGARLAGLLDAAPADEPPAPEGVRDASERATRRRTYASFGAAGAVLLVTTVCMVVAPQPVDRPHDGPARQQAAQPSSPADRPAP